VNGTHRKTLVNYEEFIVHTAVCQKTPLGLKRCQIVKKPSLGHY